MNVIKTEKHFNTARTPKHNNRTAKRDDPTATHVGHPMPHYGAPHSAMYYGDSPRRRHRPPSPVGYDYYGYHGRAPSRERGYYDYHEHHHRHYERYDYRTAPPPHYPERYRERTVSDVGMLPTLPPMQTDYPSANGDNNSLRAVSLSYSANESLKGGSGMKHSPGVVTAVDSLEVTTKPPSMSSKSTPTNAQQSILPSSSPQSDNSWKQLKQIASIDTKDVLNEAPSEEMMEPNKEVVVPTPRNKASPNGGHGLEKSISHTSSLSNSPNEDESSHHGENLANSRSEEQYYETRRGGYPAEHGQYHPHRLPHPHGKPPHLSMHYNGQPPPFDENSPSASTISTKDTQRILGMKPKHPILKAGRELPEVELLENKRRKLSDGKKDDSPANASDFGDIGAMSSWDKSGLSVCSGMTGMESLMNKDLGGQGMLSAFSFGSELSKREKKEDGNLNVEDISPTEKNVRGKKQFHVHFSQSFDQGSGHSRKRMHDGRNMPPPGRYRRYPDEYAPYPGGHPGEMPPPLPSHHSYDYSPAPPRYRYSARAEYEEDPYYDYGYHRYYDNRGYRPPPPSYHYRPPHEYEYSHQQPRGPVPLATRFPAPIHSNDGEEAPISTSWDKDDDVQLMSLMKKHKNIKNWDPIAKKLNRGKSGKECYDRWTRFLKPGSRKGQWTEEEDRVVFEAVSNSIEDPFTKWSELANQLPGRVGKQVRDRWVNHLNPNINHHPFSKKDDLKLWEGHCALGKRWVEISTKYFKSTRSENHIKNRWYSATFKKFITAEFGPDAYRTGNDQGGLGDDLPGFGATQGLTKTESAPSVDEPKADVSPDADKEVAV